MKTVSIAAEEGGRMPSVKKVAAVVEYNSMNSVTCPASCKFLHDSVISASAESRGLLNHTVVYLICSWTKFS